MRGNKAKDNMMTRESLLKVFKKNLEHWARCNGFIKRIRIPYPFDFLVLMTADIIGMQHPSIAAMVDVVVGNAQLLSKFFLCFKLKLFFRIVHFDFRTKINYTQIITNALVNID